MRTTNAPASSPSLAPVSATLLALMVLSIVAIASAPALVAQTAVPTDGCGNPAVLR